MKYYITMEIKRIILAVALGMLSTAGFAQSEELIKFGDFEKWITRNIHESAILGGARKVLLEIGPNENLTGNKAYVNRGGSPWATSNVYAKVAGIVKTNTSVYKDKHGSGSCAKLVSHIEKVKVIGMINISVLAAGSLFTGEMLEPITGTANPMSKMSHGMPFTKKPKALKFDYKVELTSEPNRIRETGFSKVKTINGKDYPQVVCVLQKRWEDEKGQIHALRIGTCIHRFTNSTDWKDNQSFTIHYGDISGESFYKSYMGLIGGDNTMYALNSKGKNVPIIEEGWASDDEEPTHAVVKFDSSFGGAYVGTPGTTLYVDNVKWVY